MPAVLAHRPRNGIFLGEAALAGGGALMPLGSWLMSSLVMIPRTCWIRIGMVGIGYGASAPECVRPGSRSVPCFPGRSLPRPGNNPHELLSSEPEWWWNRGAQWQFGMASPA